MLYTYEVRQYDISKNIDIIKYVDTPKEVYKLLTYEELLNPYCVYENLSKKDKYMGINMIDDLIVSIVVAIITRLHIYFIPFSVSTSNKR